MTGHRWFGVYLNPSNTPYQEPKSHASIYLKKRRWVLFENYYGTNRLERCCRLSWHRSSDGVSRLGALLLIGLQLGSLQLA
jgi:hypothetical protein